MSDFPSLIRVGPHDIPIVYKPSLKLDDDEFASGLFYCTGNYHIEIQQDLRGSRMAEVLLHEVLHAVWANTQFTAEKNEERAVSVLSSALTQLAKDNPDFIKSWLAHAVS